MILLIGGGESQVAVLRLAHALDVAHPVYMGTVFMSEKVMEYSNAKMRIYRGART
jgi:hypothetical protein